MFFILLFQKGFISLEFPFKELLYFGTTSYFINSLNHFLKTCISLENFIKWVLLMIVSIEIFDHSAMFFDNFCWVVFLEIPLVIQKGSIEGKEQLKTHRGNSKHSEWLQQTKKGKKFKVPKTQ
jgi:hypothetical protein